MTTNFEAKRLQWDTDYFGIESARVDLYGIASQDEQNTLIQFCRDYEFVTIFNQGNLSENNRWIGERTQAFLADMNIQFIKSLENDPGHSDAPFTVVDKLSRNDKIIQIASEAFEYSRFFNDPKLPPKQAGNIYKHWTECAFGQEGKYFVIGDRDNGAEGYILFSLDGDACIIELIAVSPQYQGRRVGQSMLRAMESFVFERGLKRIKVGTQVCNTSAIRFYSKMGYCFSGCNSLYHLWKI